MRETLDFSACCQGVGSRPGKHFCLACNSIGSSNIVTYIALVTLFCYFVQIEIMMEVSRREKQAGIVPDPDVDAYMKVPTMP